MDIPELRLLFLQSEIDKTKQRITQYEMIFDSVEIKDLSLRRLIMTKQRELEILEEMLHIKRNNNEQ